MYIEIKKRKKKNNSRIEELECCSENRGKRKEKGFGKSLLLSSNREEIAELDFPTKEKLKGKTRIVNFKGKTKRDIFTHIDAAESYLASIRVDNRTMRQ